MMKEKTNKNTEKSSVGVIGSLLKKILFGVYLILFVGIIAYALLFLIMILI